MLISTYSVLTCPRANHMGTINMLKANDRVCAVCDRWMFGLQHGYDRIPGVVLKIINEEAFDMPIAQVQWHDGNVSLHDMSELFNVDGDEEDYI